jgi:hypothetical protein
MCSLVVALAATLSAAPSFAKKAKTPPAPEVKGPPSQAVTNAVLDAIAEEMNRDIKELDIPGAPKPYYIAYKITEVDVNDVAASLGETTARRNRHFINLEAHVRVGSPAFDNGNFVVPQADDQDGTSSINLPLEATPTIARRAAWLVTDAAYKEALVQLQAKIEARKAGGALRPTDVPSWSSEKPSVAEDPVLVPPLESLDELETRAKALSAVFRDSPQLRDSHVAITSYLERRWYLNSEGNNVTDTRRASGIVIVAGSQADDGQLVGDYLLRYGRTAKDLPSDKELEADAKGLATSVLALAKAPVAENYSGPVLFEGEGAAGVVRAALAPDLGGTPVPEGLSPQDAKLYGGGLTDKIGLRVLAPFLSIVDDPTAATGDGKALIGGYKIDDEGVPAQKVAVVKDGKLVALLTSRTPSAKGQVSNGHARRTADGGAFHGSATNLLITARGAMSRRALEHKLVAAARAENLKYGLVIRRLDDAAITAAPEFTRRELVQMIKSTDPMLPPAAVLAYKVFPNGKEQLVRGVQLQQVPITAWRDLIGASTQRTVFNFLASGDPQLQERVTGGNEDGFVPSSGIESAVVTPDLLFRELDVEGSTAGERVKPVVPTPSP